jgi:sarcosine oxidase
MTEREVPGVDARLPWLVQMRRHSHREKQHRTVCDAEFVVVGAGVMGLAAGEALARAARRVIVLEQFTFGHNRGSSHGNARIFKLSYPDPGFVRLAQTSLAGWRELEDDNGDEILTTTGSIDVGEITGRREALEQCGADFEFLSAAEIERRFGLTIGEHSQALFQPEGAVLHADRAHDAFIRTARRNGIELAYETTVQHLAQERDTVLIRTSAGDLRARAVVVTAGAWVTRVLAPLGLQPDVVAVRETIAYFRPRVAGPSPPLSEWQPAEKRVTYGLVARDGLLKVGVSGSGTPTDPDEEAEIDGDVVRDAGAWAARRYDLLDDTPVRAETCLYTNTPDERFLVERHGRVVVGSACSGHGFKFAPAVGGRLADLALEATA